MALMMAAWWRLENAAAMSMERMALSVLWSSSVWVSLWSSSAPASFPIAYWCGLSVLAIVGVMCLVMALAMIRRRMVPQAMGRIWPFGFTSGMIRADARASRVVGSILPIAR